MAHMHTDLVLGIDFGTTYCRVGVWEDGRLNIIQNSHCMKETPSCVAFSEGKWLVGVKAQHQITFNPQHTYYQIRRMLGRNDEDLRNIKIKSEWPFELSKDLKGKPMVSLESQAHGIRRKSSQTASGVNRHAAYPEELAALLLAELKNMAEKALDRKVTYAVLSCPSAYTSLQRLCLKNAATIAGIEVLRFVNDTTAAAINYSISDSVDLVGSKLVLFIDFGGGCCEMSLVKVGHRTVEVVATNANCRLGGEDFDNAIAQSFLSQDDLKQFRTDPVSVHRLRIECEKAKRALASAIKADVMCDDLFPNGIQIRKPLNHMLFEQVCTKYLDKFNRLLSDLLEYKKIKTQNVDDVVVAGGSSLLPMVKKTLQDKFVNTRINTTFNTDMVAVVTGAALLAAYVDIKDGNLQGLKVVDVTPYDIELCKESTPCIPLSTIGRHRHLGECSVFREHSNIEIKEVMTTNKHMKQGRIPISAKLKLQQFWILSDDHFGIINLMPSTNVCIEYCKDVILSEESLKCIVENHKTLALKRTKESSDLKKWADLDRYAYSTKESAQKSSLCPAEKTYIVQVCEMIISRLENDIKMPESEINELRCRLTRTVKNKLPNISSSTSFRMKKQEPTDLHSIQYTFDHSQPGEAAAATSSTKQLLEGSLQQLENAAQKLFIADTNAEIGRTFESELRDKLVPKIERFNKDLKEVHVDLTSAFGNTRIPMTTTEWQCTYALISNVEVMKFSTAYYCWRHFRALELSCSTMQTILKDVGLREITKHSLQKSTRKCEEFDQWYHTTNNDLKMFSTKWEATLGKYTETQTQ